GGARASRGARVVAAGGGHRRLLPPPAATDLPRRGVRTAAAPPGARGDRLRPLPDPEDAAGVSMAAAANDPGASSGVLAPPPCGDQHPPRILRAAPRPSSLRLPLSLPGSFASLAMVTPTDSWIPAR